MGLHPPPTDLLGVRLLHHRFPEGPYTHLVEITYLLVKLRIGLAQHWQKCLFYGLFVGLLLGKIVDASMNFENAALKKWVGLFLAGLLRAFNMLMCIRCSGSGVRALYCGVRAFTQHGTCLIISPVPAPQEAGDLNYQVGAK